LDLFENHFDLIEESKMELRISNDQED